MQLFHCISFNRGFLLTVFKEGAGVGFLHILDILTNTCSAYQSSAGETDNTVF
jgi:hypothetical protein